MKSASALLGGQFVSEKVLIVQASLTAVPGQWILIGTSVGDFGKALTLNSSETAFFFPSFTLIMDMMAKDATSYEDESTTQKIMTPISPDIVEA